MARTRRALNAIESPTCLKCGAGMRTILIEEEYPGYERRTFLRCKAWVVSQRRR
jgi:hypothetical protein